MAATGKLEKMLILAFDTAEDAERGGALEAKARFEALINPETLHARVQGQDGRRPGAGHQRSADQVRVHASRGADLRLPVRQHRPDRRQAEAGRRVRRRPRVPQAAHRVPGRLARAVPPQARLGEPRSSRAGRSRSASPTSCSTPTASRSGRSSGSSSRARSRTRSAPPSRIASSPDLTHRRDRPARRHAAVHVLRGLRRPAALPVRRRLQPDRRLPPAHRRSADPLPAPACPGGRADDRHLGDPDSGHARRVLGQRADRRHRDLRRVPRALGVGVQRAQPDPGRVGAAPRRRGVQADLRGVGHRPLRARQGDRDQARLPAARPRPCSRGSSSSTACACARTARCCRWSAATRRCA